MTPVDRAIEAAIDRLRFGVVHFPGPPSEFVAKLPPGLLVANESVLREVVREAIEKCLYPESCGDRE